MLPMICTPKSLHVQSLNNTGNPILQLDHDVEKELLEMQEKGIDVNAFLRKILQKRKEEIEQEKARMAYEQEQKHLKEPIGRKSQMITQDNNKQAGYTERQDSLIHSKITHYVPAKIRKIIREEHGTKCSIPGCTRPAKILHHTARFALIQNHDPRFIAPLCEAHHEIAHKIDLMYADRARP